MIRFQISKIYLFRPDRIFCNLQKKGFRLLELGKRTLCEIQKIIHIFLKNLEKKSGQPVAVGEFHKKKCPTTTVTSNVRKITECTRMVHFSTVFVHTASRFTHPVT